MSNSVGAGFWYQLVDSQGHNFPGSRLRKLNGSASIVDIDDFLEAVYEAENGKLSLYCFDRKLRAFSRPEVVRQNESIIENIGIPQIAKTNGRHVSVDSRARECF
jgi:hypothetical protein